MIEWVVIGCVVYLFTLVILFCAVPMFARPVDAYLPSDGYAEDFAARLCGANPSPGSGRPPACHAAELGDDIVDLRKLGTGPRGLTTRTTPGGNSPGRPAAETGRPPNLYLVP